MSITDNDTDLAIAVDVDRLALVAGINAVVPFVDEDRSYEHTPMAYVLLRVADGRLQLWATNRYVITCSDLGPALGRAVTVALTRVDAKRIADFAKRMIKTPMVPIIVRENRVEVGWGSEIVAVTKQWDDDGWTSAEKTVGMIAKLVDAFEPCSPDEGPQSIMLSPTHLSKFAPAKLARDGEKSLGLRFDFPKTAGKPVRVRFSDHFTGLIMPMPMADDQRA